MSKVSAVSVDTVSTSLPIRAAKTDEVHPLAPISPDEVKNAVALVKAQWPANTDLHFKAITLQEPAKAEAVPYIEAEFHGYQLPQIDRRIFVSYYLRQTVCFQ
jgi:primary-amine oxidase